MKQKFPPELHGRKASDTFLDYIEPFFNTLLSDRINHGIYETPSLEECENIIKIPYIIWNSIIAETDPNNKIDNLAIIKNLMINYPESVKNLYEFMINRKKNEFSKYRYYIAKYKLYYNEDQEVRLKVEATMPKSSINK